MSVIFSYRLFFISFCFRSFWLKKFSNFNSLPKIRLLWMKLPLGKTPSQYHSQKSEIFFMLKEFSVAFDFETGSNISLIAGKYSNGCKQPVEVVFIRMCTQKVEKGLKYLSIKVFDSRKRSKNRQKMSTKLNWESEQQQLLKNIVENRTDLTWNEIARQMNAQFPQKCRTGKQYRERYVNYVQFGQNPIKNTCWNQNEQKELFQAYREMGTKWTVISKLIPSKSQNALKNKFYGALRKTLRKINRIGKESIKKFNKLIRYESIIRIMDASETGSQLPEQIKADSNQIKNLILVLVQRCEQQFKPEVMGELIKKIHKFNIATRCYSSKKWKKSHVQHNEVKLEYCEDESNEGQKSWRTSEHANKSMRAEIRGSQLQQARRLGKENNIINQQIPNSPISIKNLNCSILDLLFEQGKIQDIRAMAEQQNSNNPISNSYNRDLDFDLCGILNQNYVPQHFNYFEDA